MAITVTQPSPSNVQTGAAGTITISVSGGNTVLSGGAVPLAASGGVAPYNWQLMAGQLPPGVVLDPSGYVRGVPAQRGTARILVRATDSSPIPQFADAFLDVVVA
ncbi:MAG TPA: putative Ig domain-containing protein [Candidatus Acidoferrum sp.]|nr:putative Ig domain-containing protein [Candidatus Acidoferrum sp.]